MKLNNTSQYAIRIVAFMVKEGYTKKYNAKDIAEKLEIPYKYLTRIMTQLVEGGVIISTRGKEGGYSLSKNPKEIRVIDILEAVKECLPQKECILGIGLCNESKKCALHDSWSSPKKAMLDMFKNTTMDSLEV